MSETPFVSEKILKEWARFRKPGIFQVHVLSRRVQRAGEHGPPMEVVSNALTLEIRPAPAAWVKAQIDSAVTLLPDQSLPELNDTLAASLEGATPNEWLVLRYATGDIVNRVERYYLQHGNDSRCASPLVFYFLKYDPAFGEHELRRNLSTTGAQPACYDLELQFRDLGSYAMSDTLERFMIEYLSSPIARIDFVFELSPARHASGVWMGWHLAIRQRNSK